MRWPLAAHADRRFLNDEDAQYKTQNSLSIENVDFTDYDIIWMSGGWGAAYDLGFSQVLGDKISEAHAEGILLGSVCHGALGFILATDVDGRPLVEGRTMTAVTDKQVEELGIEITPQHPETELRRLNANFVSDTAFRDFFATYVAVDGNIVTGQNQNSSGETAQTLLRMLAERANKMDNEKRNNEAPDSGEQTTKRGYLAGNSLLVVVWVRPDSWLAVGCGTETTCPIPQSNRLSTEHYLATGMGSISKKMLSTSSPLEPVPRYPTPIVLARRPSWWQGSDAGF